MATTDELAERFVPKPGVTYTALTFNPRGLERAKKYHPKLDMSRRTGHQTRLGLSNTFNMRNFNVTQEQQIGHAGVADSCFPIKERNQ